MKPPQVIALLLLLFGMGFVALKHGGNQTAAVPEAAVIAQPIAESAPEAVPEPAAPVKRPVFSGPHDGSHVYQGVLCPACEKGPMEF